MHRILFALLLLAPAAHAETDSQMTDPQGDLGPWVRETVIAGADAVDLVATTYADDAEGLAITFQVVDLGILDTLSVPSAQFLWSGFFSPSHEDRSGAVSRIGAWEARAQYVATDDTWVFYLERPCLDGDNRDGCSGADRDIVHVSGIVNVASDTITVLVPRAELGKTSEGDGIYGFAATAQAQFGLAPVTLVDWDVDEQHQCMLYSFEGDITREGVMQSVAAFTNGRSGAPTSLIVDDACPVKPVADDVIEAEPVAQAEQAEMVVDGESEAPRVEAPGVPIVVLAAGIALVAFLRRQSE